MARSRQQSPKQQLIWYFQIIPVKMYQQLIVYWSDHRMVYTVVDDSHNAL